VEIEAENTELRNRVSELETENAKLKKRIQEFEEQLEVHEEQQVDSVEDFEPADELSN
jgi:predicted nuclease with TOPRIM domain